MDASTLIGAVLRPDSVPRRALLAAVRLYEICMSQPTLDELQEVMRRPEFDRYLPQQERLDFCALVTEQARLWDVDSKSEQRADGACRDAKDAKFLALALDCQAVALVSSDADLLVLHPWNSVSTMTLAAFFATVSAS